MICLRVQRFSTEPLKRLCSFLVLSLLMCFPNLSVNAAVTVPMCPKPCKCSSYSPTSKSDSSPELMAMGNLTHVLVNCSHADLATLPNSLPKNVFSLHLNGNKMKRLENISISSNDTYYAKVSIFRARNNLLSHIDIGAFDTFYSLHTLDLAYNLITDLGWSASLENTRLIVLDLSYNSIERISPVTLEPLKFLERLDLSHNYIKMVDRLSFAGFANLKYLDLAANVIGSQGLQQESLGRLNILTYLSLAENRPMTRIPDFVELGLEANSLQSLDMHGLPYVTHIESFAFQKLNVLKTLNLSFSGIQHLEQGWLNGGPHRSLETLDLSYNQLKTVNDYTFVAISTNQKLTDPNTYSDMQLDVASLPYIMTPSVGETVQHIRPITSHSINSQSLGAEWYLPLETIRWISLRNNYHLTTLEDNCFTHLPELQYLFLQNCNISSMNVASSAYRFRTTAIRQTLPNIRAMWLYNNPVICDCYVREIRYEVDNSAAESLTGCQSRSDNASSIGMQLDPEEYFYRQRCMQQGVSHSTVCFSPQNTEMHLVLSVPMSLLRCPDEPMSLLIVMLIGPLIFGAAIFMVMVCGTCSVFVRRARRYRAGKYHLMDEKLALTARDRIFKSNGHTHHRSAYHKHDYSPQTPNKESSFERKSVYRTNLVMSGMESHHGSGSGINFQVPAFLQPGARRPASPVKESPKMGSRPEVFYKQQQYQETMLSSRIDTVSRSCPNVSGVDKKPVEFWKHTKPPVYNERETHQVTTSADVNANDEVKLPLLSLSRNESAPQLETSTLGEDKFEDYKKNVDSRHHLPT